MSGLRVGAHRGCGDDYPENTMLAFKKSVEAGVQAIELDVGWTKCGTAVVLHDDHLDRTTDGDGHLNQYEYGQLVTINAAAKFRDGTVSLVERIPKLDEIIEFALNNHVRIFIDVKDVHSRVVPTILSLYEKFPKLYELGMVCSFFPSVPYLVKRSDPNILTAHTWRPHFFAYQDYEATSPRFHGLYHIIAVALDAVYPFLFDHVLWRISGAEAVLVYREIVSPRYVEMWHRRGIHPVIWTVNESSEKRWLLNTLKVPFLTDSVRDLSPEDIFGENIN